MVVPAKKFFFQNMVMLHTPLKGVKSKITCKEMCALTPTEALTPCMGSGLKA